MDDIGSESEEPGDIPEGCRFTANQREQIMTMALVQGEVARRIMAMRAVEAFGQARLQLVGLGIKLGPDNHLETDD